MNPIEESGQASPAAYVSVYAGAPAVDTVIHEKQDVPVLKSQFVDAARGKDIVTSESASQLVGRPTTMFRSDPSLTQDDFFAEGHTIGTLAAQRMDLGSLTPEQEAAMAQAFKTMALKSHVDEAVLRQEAADLEGQQFEKTTQLRDSFGSASALPDALSRAIGADLQKKVIGGGLQPDEQKRLDGELKEFAARNNLSPDKLDNVVNSYSNVMRNRADNEGLGIGLGLNSFAIKVATSSGNAFSDDGPQQKLVVPRRPDGLMPADDHAPKPFPGTPEQVAFLAELHEAEHAARGGKAGWGDEINADLAVAKFLNDTGENNIKDYWLAERGASALQWQVAHGVHKQANDILDTRRDTAFSHDTATFIRVYEQTGRQVDLDAFAGEKSGLVDKVRDRLNLDAYPKGTSVKNADIMGAVQDVLKEDQLTSVQKAEAESYLKDSTTLGYVANANYPRPQQQPAPSRIQPQPATGIPAPAF